MPLFDSQDIADIEDVFVQAGATVKLFETATDDSLHGGPDGRIPSYDTEGGVEVQGFFQPQKGGTLERLTNALMGNALGEPARLEQSFHLLASQIDFQPTVKTRLVEQDGTNWVILQKGIDSKIQNHQLFWKIPLREPR